MSSGSSSQEVACFSVDRTKYLMLSKSIADRSEPQVGIGLRSKSFRPFSRRSSIHCGSFFSAEMSRTTSSLRPRLRGRAGDVGVGPAVLVAAEALELGVELLDRCHEGVLPVDAVELGELGRVASRWVAAGRRRDVGGADTVAVGDGGQSLDVAAEQPGEHLGLGLAQLRELGRDVRDRAVVLAELVADGRAAHRGSVAVLAQRLGQRLGAVVGRRRPRQRRGSAPRARRPGGGRTRRRPRRPPVSREEAQRAGGEVVVRLVEGVAAGVGEHEDLGRAAAPAGAVDARLAGLERPSATRWSRWRRTAAGVRSSRSARAAAVDGPFSRIERATRSRVGASSDHAGSLGSGSCSPASRWCPRHDFTTPVCLN